MRPILFPENAMTFTTNGLGRIMAIRGTVEREVNGIYEVEFDMSVEDKLFPQVEISKIVCVKPSPSKGLQAFRIYKISKPINGIVTVNAEHISYQLSFIPVLPYQATSCADALAKITTYSAETNPFTFSTDKQISANWSTPDVPISARALLQGEEGSILQRFKGEYEFDNWNVTLKTHLGTNRGVVIRYGKNLVDLLQEENIENTYTGIAPYYKSDDYLLTLPEKVLHSSRADNFPYQRTIPVDLSDKFENIPTEAELRAMGEAYITENNIGVPEVSLEVEFVPLADTQEYKSIAPLETVELGDTVGVYFEKLGVNASAEVVRTIYEFVKERYDKVEIGSVKSSLSSTLAAQQSQIENQKTWVETVVQTATDMINGGLGGYVRTTVNTAGQPQEILIMDTDDTSTATNVIRLNQNGIGFSTTGYNGPFNSAWTIDGTFDASVINVINLIASKVQAYNGNNTQLLEIMSGYMDIRALVDGVWRQRVGTFLSSGSNGAIRLSSGLVDANGNPQGASRRGLLLPSSIRLGIDENDVSLFDANNGGVTVNNGTNKSILAPTYLAAVRNNSNVSSFYVDANNANFRMPINELYEGDGIIISHGKASTRAAIVVKRSDTNKSIALEVGTGGTNRGLYSDELGSWLIYTDGVRVHGYAPYDFNTGVIDSGIITLTNATGYNSYLIIADVVSGQARMTINIPYAAITTSDVSYQVADESNFLTFKIKKSGTSIVITIGNKSSTGRILAVYGYSL